MNLFDLFAKISLDTSEYEEGLESSEKKANNFGKKLKSGLKTAAKVGGAALATVGTAATALGVSFVKSAGNVAAYGDNIDKMSQKMGISAEAYQEWDAILQHSGSSIDGMQRGMMTLSNAAVNGSTAFEKLGLSQAEVASMNQEELFAATIKGLQKMEAGSERTALAQQLLGSAAKELGPLLNTSAEDTEKMRQKVHELGGVMSDEAVKAAAAYQDSLQDLNTSMTGVKNNLISSFLPSITSVMDGLTSVFSGDADGGVGKINAGVSSVIQIISEKTPEILSVGAGIVTGLVSAITENLPKLIEQGSTVLISFITGIVERLPDLLMTGVSIIASLASSIGDALPNLIPTIVSVVTSIVTTLTSPENIALIISAGVSLLGGVVDGLLQAIPTLIESIPTIIENLVSGLVGAIPQILEAGVSLMGGLISGLSEAIPTLVEYIPTIISSLITALTNPDTLGLIISSGITILGGLASGLIEAVPALVANIPEIIGSIVQGFADAGPKLLEVGKDLLGKVWDGIKQKWEDLKTWFDGIIENIKGFFSFDFELPRIPLPHFGIAPAGWKVKDLLKGVIPKLDIQWYAKAYNNPYLFDTPTVVGNRGFGDTPGPEMVYGRDALMRDIRQAVNGGGVTLNATININGDITDPREKAQELMYEMKAILDRGEAAYA